MSNDELSPGPQAETIGYGRPPHATRFRKGVSGNPKGRPKGTRNLTTVIHAALSERVTVTENGRRRRISKLEAAVKQLVNRAAVGEARATQLLLSVIQSSETQSTPAPISDFEDSDRDVVRELMRRLGREDAS